MMPEGEILFLFLSDGCRERFESSEDVVGYGEGDCPLGRDRLVEMDNIVLS